MTAKPRIPLDERLARLLPPPEKPNRKHRKPGDPDYGIRQEGRYWKIELARDGVRQRASATSMEMARAKRDAILAGLDPGEVGEPSPHMTPGDVLRCANSRTALSTYFPAWLDEHALRQSLRAKTKANYAQAFETFIQPTLGERAIGAIRRSDVASLFATVAATRSASTVHRVRNTLSGCLQFACNSDILDHNVARGHNTGEAGSGFNIGTFGVDQARAILDAVRGHQLGDFYSLLLYTGMRAGEGLALDWSRVRLNEREVTVFHTDGHVEADPGSGHVLKRGLTPPKEDKTRVVTLSEEAEGVLRRRYIAAGRPRAGFVFPSFRRYDTPCPVSHRYALTCWKNILAERGLAPMRLHDLRHAFATLLISQGTPIPIVSKLLGHADPSITYRFYAHVPVRADHDAVRILNFFTPPERKTQPTGVAFAQRRRSRNPQTPSAFGGFANPQRHQHGKIVRGEGEAKAS